MSNSDPYPIFFLPVKNAIRSALVAAGVDEMDVSFNAVERKGQVAATVLLSKQIPPTTNRVSEKLARAQGRWVDSTGANRTRVYCYDLIVHFDVSIQAFSIDKAVGAFFGFAREFPRAILDGHLFSAPGALDPSKDIGNPIELSILSPIFPDDTAVTAKDYRCSWIVRAEGGIFYDSPAHLSVTPKTRLADHTLS